MTLTLFALHSTKSHARDFFGESRPYYFAASGTYYGVLSNASTPFAHPISAELQIGLHQGLFYLGAVGEYWMATSSGGDVLSNANLGGEIGIFRTFPRVFLMVTGAAFYPLIASVKSGGTTYVSRTQPLSFRARLVTGIRVSPSLALTLGGGYRLTELDLASGGTAYSGEDSDPDLDIAGVFATAGLALLF